MEPQSMDFLSKCAEEMEAYRQLTQDRAFGSRVQSGKMQLVRVTYDAKGKSTVAPRGPWVPVEQWLGWLAEQMV